MVIKIHELSAVFKCLELNKTVNAQVLRTCSPSKLLQSWTISRHDSLPAKPLKVKRAHRDMCKKSIDECLGQPSGQPSIPLLPVNRRFEEIDGSVIRYNYTYV